jgi:peptidyl-prolyl cis-trans isomerase D
MQFVLLLFIFPSFAFFGLESYSRFQGGDNAVAKVAGQTITQEEWDAAQREQMERLRQMFGQQFDTKMFDTPEARRATLENLIARKAIAAEAAHEHLSVSDQALQQVILAIPGLTAADGKFDSERYKSLLEAQGMTPAIYEARLRQDMALQQLTEAIEATAFAPKAVADRLADLQEQEREIQQIAFKPADFAGQVKITDDMLKAYYDKHAVRFEVPEQIKAEYLVLDMATVASQISVSDADVKSYYEQNVKHYTEDEQRHARHILIKADKNAPEAERAAAKAKAEKLLEQLRKNPADFARLAKENSQDPGSAAQGGDLGFFGKGMMVKPFEDTVYKLKEGEISEVIQTDFGYHIIQLVGVKPASVKPLEQVKDEIAAEIKKQQAAKKFSEMAEVFSNTVYEQADSLKPAADKLNLKIQTIADLTRTPNPALPAGAPFNQPKFLQAIFSDEAVKNKHNTEAVEVAPNTLIAGHVLEHKPVTRKPFEDVKAQVRELVMREQSAELAKKAGEAKLAAVREAGAQAGGFGEAKTVSRSKPENLDAKALAAVMKADTGKLPAYVGVDLGEQGYAVFRINKVGQPATQDAARRAAERQQITGLVAREQMYAYLEYLKKKYKAEILKPVGNTESAADEQR